MAVRVKVLVITPDNETVLDCWYVDVEAAKTFAGASKMIGDYIEDRWSKEDEVVQ